jgi:hypothetical protein
MAATVPDSAVAKREEAAPPADPIDDSHPYRPCYELGSVLFGAHQQPEQITSVESTFSFPAECPLNLLVPMGPQFLPQYRTELESTGRLSLESRWADATHCVGVLRQLGLLG